MPLLFFVLITVIWLAGPLYGITVILLNTQRRPHHRNILALGGGVLINTAIITMLAVWGSLLQGTVAGILPLVIIWGAALAAWHLLHTTSLYH